MKILDKIFSDNFVIICFLVTILLSILKLTKVIKIHWLLVFLPISFLITLLFLSIIVLVISSIILVFTYRK